MTRRNYTLVFSQVSAYHRHWCFDAAQKQVDLFPVGLFFISAHPLGEAAMSRPTQLLPHQLVKDLHAVLARLRTARLVGDTHEERVCENRLNWLIDKLPRSTGNDH